MRTIVWHWAPLAARCGVCSAGLAALILALCAPPSAASAKQVKSMEDATLFGTLDQAATNCPNVNCGPTAAVNSFVYLQNAFPKIYKTPLVPTVNGKTPSAAEQKAVANKLGTDYMKNCCGTSMDGTNIGDFILGKMDYIEAQDKSVTIYAAQIPGMWANVIPKHLDAPKPAYVQQNTIPTLSFIAAQLGAKEDVEILLDNDKGQLHYLTLTGLDYNDATNMGTFNYVDPLGGGRSQAKILGLGGDKFIQTDYKLAGINSDIAGVVAESPIPEPGTWLLLGVGMAFLGPLLRRKRASALRA
jgi:hypothetical protein